MASELKQTLTKRYGAVELWEIIVIALFAAFILILAVSVWLSFRKKSKRSHFIQLLPITETPRHQDEIKDISVDHVSSHNNNGTPLDEKFSERDIENGDNNYEKHVPTSETTHSPHLSGLQEGSHIGWGHWFTLRDLQVATNHFSKENIIGDGGYGVVYHGTLTNKTPVAVKKLLNNPIKVLVGTAKALAYLHEAIEPKVVHRDIKSSNILMNDSFDAKLSDFGLAKLLGADKSYVSTRVMGTFGYVAPEYANSGLLNEKSDVYSFGVVLLEAITGRYPVDYERPKEEVHMVEWLKLMVQQKQFEQVVDKELEIKPTTSELKRALLTALRCVDPDADKRPKMSQVARMLESDEYPVMPREERRRRKQPRESTDTNKDDIIADAKI
ncbi:hypothetical protein IGI04_020257 [Brassica rapa subsp. trilocularis]|uniref:non-specific serine/threonine protein kinase n=2 Tax=Brassica TaxID=3705 RepID=A0ABQ8DF45_BRANA|nr:hypothetical protein IGI04_020257 [Brassica rapa subsp. trilocularis]KAH0927070.1 hypothetical protein HID58_019326 [Brassica napus]